MGVIDFSDPGFPGGEEPEDGALYQEIDFTENCIDEEGGYTPKRLNLALDEISLAEVSEVLSQLQNFIINHQYKM
ncbi:MAG: hypothetical protein Q9M91_05040 [Candidatus Dojkabacteria bacterium]|nr:hypothetical protein [Candidatus Dojkabacteria bacterium]MDQ7021172.1 hypothetical protein [Candidatus Dojkabacteria bacterium]